MNYSRFANIEDIKSSNKGELKLYIRLDDNKEYMQLNNSIIISDDKDIKNKYYSGNLIDSSIESNKSIFLYSKDDVISDGLLEKLKLNNYVINYINYNEPNSILEYDLSNKTIFIAKNSSNEVNQKLISELIHDLYDKHNSITFIINDFDELIYQNQIASMIIKGNDKNITFNLSIKDFTNLKNIYNEEAYSIFYNISTQIFSDSKDYETREEISKLCGNIESGRLINADELANLNKDEVIILIRRCYPIRCNFLEKV